MLSSPNDESPANIEAAVSALDIILFLCIRKGTAKLIFFMLPMQRQKHHPLCPISICNSQFLDWWIHYFNNLSFNTLLEKLSAYSSSEYSLRSFSSSWAKDWNIARLLLLGSELPNELCSCLHLNFSCRRIGEKRWMSSRKRLGTLFANLRKCSERGSSGE